MDGHAVASSAAPRLAFGQFGGPADRGSNPLVGATPANVRDFPIDVAVRGVSGACQQGRHRHDLAGLAITALRHIVLDPGTLDRMLTVWRQTLNRDNVTIEHGADRQHARARRPSIHMYRAGTTLRDATPVFRAGEGGVIAREPQQRGCRLSIDLVRLAIHTQGQHGALLLQGARSAIPIPAARRPRGLRPGGLLW